MKPGRCAYGIMLGEDGMVMDDGVMARLGERHFYLTTTTGGAARVMGWLEQWLQTEWPDLKVYLTSVTDRWSTIALVGPDSRKLLQALDSDMAFGRDEFPFMSVRSGSLAGFAVRVFRVSFSGELAFEINVESDFAPALWETLVQAGEQYGITPYGTETMHVLRAEKGFTYRRPGYRWFGNAPGPGYELAVVRRQGLSRQTFPGPARLPKAGAQTTGRPAG